MRSMSAIAGAFAALVVTHVKEAHMMTDANEIHEEDTEFANFIAHHRTQTCTPRHKDGDSDFPKNIRGVNLGGWMVLEPWITPSLFYQFLGEDEDKVGMDMYTFCQVLGPKEGNRQLRRHWDAWLTEEIVDELADSGAVNSFRLPVGDWMYEPYGPYIGCTDGALEYVDRFLGWARARGISVLLDIHGLKGSQNGFDNSGQTLGLHWTTKDAFEHWPTRMAEWIGEWDSTNRNYTSINQENVAHSLRVVQAMVLRYKDDPNIFGLSPVNEPWEETPKEALKSYYWEAYLIVKKDAPHWKYVIHDSFRFEVKLWGGFMKGCPDRALDTHMYQAWNDPGSRVGLYNDACGQRYRIEKIEREFGPVLVGEWSLATDNCAMWLNGFNDNAPGYPRVPCKYVKCSTSYLDEQPGVPIDPIKGPQPPFGSGGVSGPQWGYCPTTRDWWKESSFMSNMEVDWLSLPPAAPSDWDDTDVVMSTLAKKKLHAFLGFGHGYYFWNFRTELDQPQWSYMGALERGWIPKGENLHEDIRNSCDKEERRLYNCAAKRRSLENSTRNAVLYALQQEQEEGEDDIVNSSLSMYWGQLHGTELYEKADELFDRLWKQHPPGTNATACYFNGTAEIVEQHENYPDLGNFFCSVNSDNGDGGAKHSTILPTFGWVLLAMALGTLMGFRMGRSSKGHSSGGLLMGLLFQTKPQEHSPSERMPLMVQT